ncbi:MAG TPA: ATP-binding protein [Thermoanaerobaculia bacterium]|jgi:hypothetical protein|nr:ATP-binding protein [Thermoanaerobaculia bacterium]
MNPFPGLRPFAEKEEQHYFGREPQIDAMLDKLAATHFLAVVGMSGSGKSSLVNCGLRPALHRGILAGAGTVWRMAQFRPGNRPTKAMAAALAEAGVFFNEEPAGPFTPADIIESSLRMSKLGLLDVFQDARLSDDTNLLVVVDQFEELFRYQQIGTPAGEGPRGPDDEVVAFVNLLLEVRGRASGRIYVVLTMRSDFLGECAQFYRLPEAINEGQYLVPRMTRDERRHAIAGPVCVECAEIDPVLLTRLVNDVGANPDQLSILQHALNRTWARWKKDERGGPITLRHYEDIGTMAHALDQHAEKAFAELTLPREREICEKMFKALTDKATDPRGIRRPTSVEALLRLTGAEIEELRKVIDVFRKPSRSFLMPPVPDILAPQAVVDISHESLMRVWDRLRDWADDEARSARTYRRLSETAALHAIGKASLWRDAELDEALNWRERMKPDAAWAERYAPGFPAAMEFLQKSAAERETKQEQERAAALKAARTERTLTWLVSALILTVVVIAALIGKNQLQTKANQLQIQADKAELDKKAAKAQAKVAARGEQTAQIVAVQPYAVAPSDVADPHKVQKSFAALVQISAITATASPIPRADITIEYFKKPTDSEKRLNMALHDLGFHLREVGAQNPRETNCVWYGSAAGKDNVKLVAYTVIRAGLDLQCIQPLSKAHAPNTIQVGHGPKFEDETPFTVDAVKGATLTQLLRNPARSTPDVFGSISSLNPTAREGTINCATQGSPVCGPNGSAYFRFDPNPEPLKAGDHVTFTVYQGPKRFYAEGVTPVTATPAPPQTTTQTPP